MNILQIATINRAVLWIRMHHGEEAGRPSYRRKPLDMTSLSLSTTAGGKLVGFENGQIIVWPNDASPGAKTMLMDFDHVLLCAVTHGMVPAKIKWSGPEGDWIWQGVLAVLRGMFLNVEAPL